MNKFSALVFAVAIALTGPMGAAANDDKQVAEFVEKITKLEGTTPAQWRILWTGDASTEATISWSTAQKGAAHTVYYDTEPHGADVSKYSFQQASQNNGLYASTKRGRGMDAYYHHTIIKGLKPATTYHFVLKSDDSVSRPLHFITAPESGTDFSLIHGGDSRSGHLARCQMNSMISDMAAKDASILGFIHGGDYIQKGNHRQQWLLWMSQHELTTTSEGRVLPLIQAIGNHDGGKTYYDVFNVGKGKPRWHTTTLGEHVAVVTLDTNAPGGGAQAEWMEGEFKRLRPKVKWLLANYHRPIYPAVKGPKRTGIFAPIFEKYDVDLACESDGHCIKRTVPIRKGKEDPTGVTYIGEGGLGVGQRDPKGDRWYLNNGVVGKGHHVMRLDFTDETLRIRTILLGGEVFDDHRLKARQ